MTSLYLQARSMWRGRGECTDLSQRYLRCKHEPQQMHGSARACSSWGEGGVWRRACSPGEDARNVLCRLPLADLDRVGAQVDGMTSQPEEALRSSIKNQAQLCSKPSPREMRLCCHESQSRKAQKAEHVDTRPLDARSRLLLSVAEAH